MRATTEWENACAISIYQETTTLGIYIGKKKDLVHRPWCEILNQKRFFKGLDSTENASFR